MKNNKRLAKIITAFQQLYRTYIDTPFGSEIAARKFSGAEINAGRIKQHSPKSNLSYPDAYPRIR